MYLIRLTCKDCGRDYKVENTDEDRSCPLCTELDLRRAAGEVSYDTHPYEPCPGAAPPRNRRNGRKVIRHDALCREVDPHARWLPGDHEVTQ